MSNLPVVTAPARDSQFTRRVSLVFRVILGAAIILALLILILPGKVFLAFSNYLQIFVALAGSLVFLFLWKHEGEQEYLLYTGGALGLWGIANIFWYVNILLGLRNEVFPSLIDMGMIASIFLMSIAFQKGLPRKQIAPHILLGLLVLFLLVPAGVIVTTGFSAASLVTLLYHFACGSMIIIGLNHSLKDHPAVLAGAILFALTFVIYPLREMFLISNPVLPVIGTFVAAGFSLIVIGMLGVARRKNRVNRQSGDT